jgi:hypothetical protein
LGHFKWISVSKPCENTVDLTASVTRHLLGELNYLILACDFTFLTHHLPSSLVSSWFPISRTQSSSPGGSLSGLQGDSCSDSCAP